MERKNYKILGIRISALIEIIVFLSVINICSYYFGAGERCILLYPHPYWIILLVVIIQYDLKETIVCVILMVLFLYVGNMPVKRLTDTTFQYYLQLSIRPVLWLAAAVVMDALRTKRMKITTELIELIKESNEKLEVISSSYSVLQKRNKSLESRLAGELNSAVKIYNVAKKLEHMNSSNYMNIMEQIILAVMSPPKFSIFTIGNKGLSMKYASCIEEGDSYRDSFSNSSKLYNSIVVLKKRLCVIHESDERVLQGEGILAGPMIDISSGEVMGMLKFEKIRLIDLTSKNLELFNVLCGWLGSAYKNALSFNLAQSNSMVSYDQILYSKDFLNRQVNFLISLAKRLKFNVTSLSIKIANSKELPLDTVKEAVILLSKTVKKKLRSTDEVFDEDYRSGSYLLLLPGTDEQGAENVLDEIKKCILYTDNGLNKVKYSFVIQVLNKCEN